MEASVEASPDYNRSGNSTSADDISDFEAIDVSEVIFYVVLYKIGVPSLFGLIMLVGLTGNSLVICVTVMQRKMQTTVNLLLLNLAFSDFAFLVLCVPFMTYHFAAENWVIGDAACKVMQFTVYVTVYVTVYSLVCISVLRFRHVVCSTRSPSRQQPSRANTALVVCFIWAVMLTANAPILVIYRVKEYHPTSSSSSSRYGEPYYYCGMDDPELHGRRLFLSFFVLTYIAPLSIISTMYFLILRYVNARKASLLRATANQIVSAASVSTNRRASHASRISMAIIVAFGMCWLPLHINLLVVHYGIQPQTRVYQVVRVLCHVAAYSNSCINPLVYHCVSTDFRRNLRSFWRRNWGCLGRTDLWSGDTVLKEWTRPADTRDTLK